MIYFIKMHAHECGLLCVMIIFPNQGDIMASIFDLFKKIEKTESSAPITKIIVGLGNPGDKYTTTRHNAGFMALDVICEKYNFNINKLKFKSLCGEADINGVRVLFLKPQTFMNNSGEAISAAASFYKIPPEKILVLVDDICQAPGRMRIRKSGSAGGQKGLANIISHLGTDAFPRIRIGVGEKPNPEYDLCDWVLGKFSESDMKALAPRLDDSYDSIIMILDGKIDDAMGKFNGKR